MMKKYLLLSLLSSITFFAQSSAYSADKPVSKNNAYVKAGTTPESVKNNPKDSISKPIFVNPYKQKLPTYQSRVPNLVGTPVKTSGQRNYTASGRKSKYVIVDDPDPFAGTSFGRIRTEQDFFDKNTKQYLNQYDYMAALHKSGNKAELNAVVQKVQKNGVFDPKKYQDAIRNAENRGANGLLSSDNSQLGQVGKYGSSSDASNTRNAAVGIPDKPAVNYVVKQDGKPIVADKKFDAPEDDTTINPAAEKVKNNPIFLR
jgi:hypothetical protein